MPQKPIFSRYPLINSFQSGLSRGLVRTEAGELVSLYRKINERVIHMIDAGLEKEVADLLREGIPENAQSMNAIGYKEMIPCIKGLTDIETAVKAIQTGSRHYAKRQMTFLRKEPDIQYVDITLPDAYTRISHILK